MKSWVNTDMNRHLHLWAVVGLINIKQRRVLSTFSTEYTAWWEYLSTVYEILFKYILIWFLACQQLGAPPVALQDTEPYLLVIFTFTATLLMPTDTYSSGNLMPVLVCVWDGGRKVYKHRMKHSWHLKYVLYLDLYMYVSFVIICILFIYLRSPAIAVKCRCCKTFNVTQLHLLYVYTSHLYIQAREGKWNLDVLQNHFNQV